MSTQPSEKTLAQLVSIASSQTTFENMQKLSNMSEYEIPVGSGIKYKRKMLKPRDLVKLQKLQKEYEITEDPEERMKCLKQEAEVCLDGITDDKWEETDIGLMEIVIGACILISSGFRKV